MLKYLQFLCLFPLPQQISICGYGGIGRRAGFRFQWATVWVQIPLPVPSRSRHHIACSDFFLKVRARTTAVPPFQAQPFTLGCDLGSAAPLQFLACGQERRESAAGLKAGFCGVSICVCNFKSSILTIPSPSGVREILLRFSFPPLNLGTCFWLGRGTLRRCAGSGERAGQPFTGAAVHKFSATCGKVAPPSAVWRRVEENLTPKIERMFEFVVS